MKYRRLGSTGMSVSVVGVGAWQLGGEWGHDYSQAEADAIFDKAREVGINLIDTAECYGDHLSETFVGKAIEKDREDWVLATKFGHKFLGHIEREQQWAPDQVRQQLEASLKALRTDYVDLYQFHSGDDEAFGQDEIWEMLRGFVDEGKVRHLGVSISSNRRNTDIVGQTEAAPSVGAQAIQLVYNRLDRSPEEDILPICRDKDLGVLARVPLASGFLSGKYKPGQANFDQNDVRANRDQEKLDNLLRRVQDIHENEVPEGVPMAEWALAWCLQHPAVTCVIPGCKNAEQVESNARAADLEDLVRDDHPQAL